MRGYNLPTFTASKTITNLTKYELSQEESDLLKAGLNFSIQSIFYVRYLDFIFQHTYN